MTSKNNYSLEKNPKSTEKKTWIPPAIAEINIRAVKQQEEELYLQMLADPEVFQRLANSNEPPN